MNKNKTRNFSVKCTLVIPDTHFQAPVNKNLIAPDFCHDPNAISLMLQVANARRPDEIVHLGDICEMGTVSAWTKEIGKEGQIKGVNGEYYQDAWSNSMKMVKDFWGYIHKIHPQAELHQLEGNHDFWSKLAFEQPTLAPFADELAFRKQKVWAECGIDYKPYDGNPNTEMPWVDVGRVRVLHGYKNVSASRMRLEHDNTVYGHQHKILYNAWDANSREMRRAWSIGCLTKLKPDYNSRGGAQNGWTQAFAMIYTMPDETFSVKVIEITGGHIVDFDGKPYFPKPLSNIDKGLKSLELP